MRAVAAEPEPAGGGSTLAQGDLDRRDGPSGRTGLVARIAIVLGAVMVAYHHSLLSLVRVLGVDSPLAYVGLVPFLALGLVVVLARPRPGELAVHDRYLDIIVGATMMAVALGVMLVMPARLSTFFWVYRIDLLTLPLFVAGAVSLVFGIRTTLRVAPALAFLFLAWPVPFRLGLARFLDPFTDWTIRATELVTGVVPVAERSTADGVFTVVGPDEEFRLVIASACSGANSLLGFLLVGGALMWVCRGRRAAKGAWLVSGLAALWVLNVVRIVSIFGAGRLWGESFAIDVLHPYVGLVIFAAVMFAMVVVMPRFGLAFGRFPPGRRREAEPLGDSVRRAVPVWSTSAVIVVVIGCLLGVLDRDLRSVDPVVSALGEARLEPFAATSRDVAGFEASAVDQFEWSRRFFGQDSDWTRWEYAGEGAPGFRSDIPLVADVVTTADVQTFNDFDVEACYRFHGHDVRDVRQVELGLGTVGTLMSWTDATRDIEWISLYWYWPVEVDGEDRYQRIVLLLNADADGRIEVPAGVRIDERALAVEIDEAFRDRPRTGGDDRDALQRAFVVTFGREIVRTAAERSAVD